MSNEKKSGFTDQDILTDIMHSAKLLQNLYNTYASEASNDSILEVIEDLYLAMKDQARDMFNLLYSKGWYKLESEDNTKINELITKFDKCRQEM